MTRDVVIVAEDMDLGDVAALLEAKPVQAHDARDATGQGLGGTGPLKMLGTAVNLASRQAKRPSIREIPV
jgi:hypothetical protein